MINFPSQPSISCGNLESLAGKGAVKETECGIVKGFATDVCGCQHPDATHVPTDSPQGRAPTLDPVGAEASDASGHKLPLPSMLVWVLFSIHAIVAN